MPRLRSETQPPSDSGDGSPGKYAPEGWWYAADERANRPHRRDELAGMFWPERPTTAARNNLRQVLYRLREAIGEQGSGTSFLQVTYSDIQFDPGSDYWLDVKQFSSMINF